MSTQSWIIAAVVVVLFFIAYFAMRPTGETPAGTATTEQTAPAN